MGNNGFGVNNSDARGQNTPTNVTVTDTTTHSKQTPTTTQAIERGKCMRAQGKNSGCVLQATIIRLELCAHRRAARTTIFTSATSPFRL